MPRWLFVTLCLAGFALAETLTLDEALRLAPEADAEVITAQSELAAAERELARLRADPLALRLDRLNGEQAVERAQEALQSSLTGSRVDAAELYLQALEADEAYRLALMERELAGRTLEAQNIRLAAGAVTQLEVERANNDYLAAVRNADDAQAARTLAYAELSSRLGRSAGELALIDDELLTLPGLEGVMTRAWQRAASRLLPMTRPS